MSLIEQLSLGEDRIVALCGAGGKTSLRGGSGWC